MRIALISATLAAALALAPAARAGGCDRDAWAFYGAVRDAAGNPVADASVRLLLDDYADAFDARKGDRRVAFRTNAFGKFQAGLVCTDVADRANPCAVKPKVLAIHVSADGYAERLVVHRVKDLDVRVDADEGYCFVALPEFKLARD